MKLIALLAAVLLAGTAFQVEAQTYTYVDLGVTPYSDTFATGSSYDNQVGYGLVGGQPQALTWHDTPESATALPSTGYQSTQANGVYQTFAAGSGTTTGGQTVALLWSGLNSAPTNLNPSFASSSVVNGISGASRQLFMAGSATLKTTGQQVAVQWLGTSPLSGLNLNPSGATSSQGLAAAGYSGSVVGSAVFSGVTHAMFWSGTTTDLHPSGALRSEALGASTYFGLTQPLTTYTVEVGDYTTSAGAVHACLWVGTAASIVDLHPTTGSYKSTVATGVFSLNQGSGNSNDYTIVGYGTRNDGTTAPLLWTVLKFGSSPTSVTMTDLSTYMPAGTTSSRALAIDTNYFAAASGFSGVAAVGVATINGSNHAFLIGVFQAPAFETVAQNLSTLVGVPYSYQAAAISYPAATYSAASLPPGLGISATTGLISGTPTQTGTFTGTVTATNSLNGTTNNASQKFTIKVIASPPILVATVGSFSPANGTGLHQAMVMGADGNFYGTSTTGGAGGGGTVYKMTPDGTQTTLHAFGDGSVTSDGVQPQGLSFGNDGALYGTTFAGGSAGEGTIFKISGGTTSILHHFGDGSVTKDGANPATSLLLATDGNFYGVTPNGGTPIVIQGRTESAGTFFSMNPSGNVSILHDFISLPTDGNYPDVPLIQAPGSSLSFYGITETGGGGQGDAFSLTSSGAVSSMSVFPNPGNPEWGFRPHGPLVVGTDSNLYGIASAGGISEIYDEQSATGDPTTYGAFGLGAIYKLTTSGVLTDLHDFGDGTVGNDGSGSADRNAPLVQGIDGNFYGVTAAGGSANQGCLFQITPTGTMTVLHSFGDGTVANDGLEPAPVFFKGTDGFFYGVTQMGGANGNGTIYKFSVNFVPIFNTTTFPSNIGYMGLPYSTYTYSLTNAVPGFPATTFTVASGALPPGITLSPSGVLSGTPTATGKYVWFVNASNNAGTTKSLVSYSITVILSQAPTIANGPPTNGVVSMAYSFPYSLTGRPFPMLSVTAGALPPGLTLSSTGVITGMPTAAGIYTGTVTADNQDGSPATQDFSITIAFNYSSWVAQYNLTGANAAATAVVSPDGLPNLVKYSLGLSPLITYNPGATGLPSVQMTTNPTGPQSLALSFNGSAADVTYNVQATNDLNAGWTMIATFPGGGTAPGQQTVQDSQDITVSPKRFMRLQVTSP